MMNITKYLALCAGALLACFNIVVVASSADATSPAPQAAVGSWSGSGKLTGNNLCSTDFTMSFAVSEAGLVSGSLVTAQGAEGFRNTYQLRGKIDPADGHSFQGEASSKYVLHLSGSLDGDAGSGGITFPGRKLCIGQWSATLQPN